MMPIVENICADQQFILGRYVMEFEYTGVFVAALSATAGSRPALNLRFWGARRCGRVTVASQRLSALPCAPGLPRLLPWTAHPARVL
jgi:hypothetical protein